MFGHDPGTAARDSRCGNGGGAFGRNKDGVAGVLAVGDEGEGGGDDAGEDGLAPVADFGEAGAAGDEGADRAVTGQVAHLVGHDERDDAPREETDGSAR